MQTPKSKSNHLDGSQRPAVRSNSDSVSSAPHQNTRTTKDRSPKIIERRSPQGRANEKRSNKHSDLEACVAQLQEELKRAKDQASSYEFQNRQAQQDVEEGKRQISAISAELKETKNQLIEISSSEDDRLQELCKVSQERDKAWESELEAVRKQHSMDLAALNSAMYEIQKLKKQVEMVTELEAVQTRRAECAEGEVRKLKYELGETAMLMERLKADLKQSKETEAHAQETASEACRMLETVSLSANMVESACHDQVAQPFISSSKSDQSEYCKAATESSSELEDKGYINQLEHEIRHLKSEVSKMRAALDASELRYREEYIQSTLQIRSAYELVEVAKSESRIREAELEAELKMIKSDMQELQAKQKENDKPRLSDKENVWVMELKKARASLADTKASLIEKENQLQDITEENEKLNMEIQKLKTEKTRAIEDASTLAKAEKDFESKIIHLTQEADQNSERLAQVMELLDAAQAANAEMEAELRRITVQCDQWRKAAEAAAVMLTTGSGGKYMDRSESLDSSYHTIGRHLSSPHSDDTDDDPSKRKLGSMLQKMGVKWKKTNSSKHM